MMSTKQELIEYCKTLPGAYEDYPFGEEWTVMRHSVGAKSFALIFEREGVIWANLKCEPMEAEFLRSVYKSVVPAYHMNKVHWNSVILDGGVPDDEVKAMVRRSFELTKIRRKKPQKAT